MVREGDIYYNTMLECYYLVIGAKRISSKLSFYAALCRLENDETISNIGIVMVCLLNNKNYRKSIQTQKLDCIYLEKLMYSKHMIYDRHISISPYKTDILKRKLLDNSLTNIKDLYLEQKLTDIRYLSSCVDFLEQFQMFQYIVVWDSIDNMEDSAVYLGILDGEIVYYSKRYDERMTIPFENFKVSATQDNVVEDKKAFLREHDMQSGLDINIIKNLIQRQKSIFQV